MNQSLRICHNDRLYIILVGNTVGFLDIYINFNYFELYHLTFSCFTAISIVSTVLILS